MRWRHWYTAVCSPPCLTGEPTGAAWGPPAPYFALNAGWAFISPYQRNTGVVRTHLNVYRRGLIHRRW